MYEQNLFAIMFRYQRIFLNPLQSIASCDLLRIMKFPNAKKMLKINIVFLQPVIQLYPKKVSINAVHHIAVYKLLTNGVGKFPWVNLFEQISFLRDNCFILDHNVSHTKLYPYWENRLLKYAAFSIKLFVWFGFWGVFTSAE